MISAARAESDILVRKFAARWRLSLGGVIVDGETWGGGGGGFQPDAAGEKQNKFLCGWIQSIFESKWD